MTKTTKKSKTADLIAFSCFGIYLLLGALYSFLTTHWFPGFPPQFDVSMLFGGVVGIYVESALALSIGLASLSMSTLLWINRKQDKAQ